jgi:hypothetical protein
MIESIFKLRIFFPIPLRWPGRGGGKENDVELESREMDL